MKKLFVFSLVFFLLIAGCLQPPAKPAPPANQPPIQTNNQIPSPSTFATNTPVPPAQKLNLTLIKSVNLPENTHRPELVATPDGKLILVVWLFSNGKLQPGKVNHRAYVYDPSMNLEKTFDVAADSAEYGSPADHRITIANGELLVTYQSILMNEGVSPDRCQPSEACIKEQSLMLARFSQDGKELSRKPIVGHSTDFGADSFADHAILWKEGKLIVTTGNYDANNVVQGSSFKIREVDLDGKIISTKMYQVGAQVGSSLGNGLVYNGKQLLFLSANMDRNGNTLTFNEMGSDYSFGFQQKFADNSRNKFWPVGPYYADSRIYLGYLSMPKGSPPNAGMYPWLQITDGAGNVLFDEQMGGKCYLHGHPVVTIIGDKLYYTVSLDNGGKPQVRLDEYEIHYT